MSIRAPILLASLTLSCPAFGEDGSAFFENRVRPILVEHCYKCHSEQAGERKGGLWLDRRKGWQIGGESGPAVLPGDPDASLVVQSVRYLDETLQMPPKNRLPSEAVKTLEQWVAMGAPDPRDAALARAVRRQGIDIAAAKTTWAFRPHQSPIIPKVRDGDWARDPIDRFVLHDLERANLKPAADAAPAPLLRRLFFDLTGLPPTRGELLNYTENPSPANYARIVDDLLSRASFGERWGRHWLDVARYSDSNGGDRNFTYYQAWRYRNYVIDSFNRDRPFYEFVRQQLAGDLMPFYSDQERHDQLVASTFVSLGPKMLTERDKEKLRLDTADEQVDTVGRAFLGLTLGCARCHDHKFDPVSQEDYYALAGIFRSTQVVLGTRNGCVNVASWIEQALPGPEPQRADTEAKVARLELAMRLTVEQQFKQKAGGKMSADKLPLGGVIYDEADAELTGTWRKSSLNGKRFGDGYVVHDPDTEPSRAVFRASLPENGVYEVRIAHSSDRNRARDIPVTVEARDKIHHLKFDQTKTPDVAGLFQTLGRFDFEKGGRANLIIESDGTRGYLILDAVQFIAVKDIDRETKALADAMDGSIDPLFSMNEGELKKELSRLIRELKTADVAMAPRDAADAADIHLRIRGETGRLGALIPRGFPEVITDEHSPTIQDGQSGRLQLAQWITAPENALLDRVMVNRVWHHLFGRGIVASVDNFGTLGSGPSNLDLLDYLSTRFRETGGSVKPLIRDLVLSHTYRLGADAPKSLLDADPENKLFGRHSRRRLSAEEIRDSVLFLSGKLSPSIGTATSAKFGEDLDKPMSFSKETLRTVYLPIARNNPVAELDLFDAANPDLVSGSRATTTVPTQSLYLLNNNFFLEQARSLNRRSPEQLTGEQRVNWLYESVLNRPAQYIERQRALEFIETLKAGGSETEAFAHLTHLLLVSTEFLFLD
jgi:hypothetical protein